MFAIVISSPIRRRRAMFLYISSLLPLLLLLLFILRVFSSVALVSNATQTDQTANGCHHEKAEKRIPWHAVLLDVVGKEHLLSLQGRDLGAPKTCQKTRPFQKVQIARLREFGKLAWIQLLLQARKTALLVLCKSHKAPCGFEKCSKTLHATVQHYKFRQTSSPSKHLPSSPSMLSSSQPAMASWILQELGGCIEEFSVVLPPPGLEPLLSPLLLKSCLQ